MTGIERLRELAGGINPRSVWSVTSDEYDKAHGLDVEHKGGQLRDFLADIADQIEREHEGDLTQYHVPWSKVQDVMLDMERHVLGHEGMEDSPVARWARELREALGGNGRDPAEDVSMSAYDLLPQEDRDAIAWVRDHGGLEKIKLDALCWNTAENIAQTTLDWLARVCPVAGIEKCGYGVALERLEDAINRRLMPEGYEWPRYETGELLRYKNRYIQDGREREVWHVDFDSCGEPTILNKYGTRFHPDKGERVKRPAPKADTLTHERPDSWERIEEDARSCTCVMEAIDLVRRARALSERGE